MSFAVPADSYDRYMGGYSRLLAPLLADFARVQPGQVVLDVGCGPGALTAELASRIGADHVAAVDPSPGFVVVCATRVASADVRNAPAEKMPWPDDSFDAALSQLVLNFLDDANAGVREMRRVVRDGGSITACTWDYGGEMQMLRTFWDAALALDPAAPDEARVMLHIDPNALQELWLQSDLREVETATLTVRAHYPDFEDYWQPFLTGTGPGGAYCMSLDPGHRAALRDECFDRLGTPAGSFTLTARAWAVRGLT